jgi:hypothetical protein
MGSLGPPRHGGRCRHWPLLSPALKPATAPAATTISFAGKGIEMDTSLAWSSTAAGAGGGPRSRSYAPSSARGLRLHGRVRRTWWRGGPVASFVGAEEAVEA